MLSDEDRVAGHCGAGRYLEAVGECDPMVLAEHYARGKDKARSGEFYARAAEQAHWLGDASTAIARAEQALEQDLPAPLRATMLALIAEEHGWRMDFHRAWELSEEVRRLSTPGSVQWAMAIAPGLFGAHVIGQKGAADALVEQLCRVQPEPSALSNTAFGIMAGSYWCSLDGQVELSSRLVARQRELVEPVAHKEPVANAWYCMTRTFLDAISDAGPASALRFGLLGRETFQSLGHRRGELLAQIYIGKVLWMLGQMEEAERALLSTFVPGVAYGPADVDRLPCLLEVLLAQGAVDKAERVVRETLGALARRHELALLRKVTCGMSVRGPRITASGMWGHPVRSSAGGRRGTSGATRRGPARLRIGEWRRSRRNGAQAATVSVRCGACRRAEGGKCRIRSATMNA